MEVMVMRLVSCLLFSPVEELVSRHSVIFHLLVHHINLLILPLLYLSEYTAINIISKRRGGGLKNKSSHRRIIPGMMSRGRKLG